MNIKRSLVDFAVVFTVALVVMVIVTFLWNFFIHASAIVDWETSFRFAIIFAIIYGIILPLVKTKENKNIGK